jgi:DNA polymerase-3 subunit delta
MNRPESVYLLLGPESGEKSSKLKEIRALCREYNGGDEPEIHRFYPFETEQGEILSALQNSSLFASHRLVVLSEADELKAPVAAMITSYLAKPSDSATLVIISSKNSVHQSIMKAVPNKQRIMFWELFENQKKDWLIRYFKQQGLEISLEAVELILSLVENNTQELRIVSARFAAHLLGSSDKTARTEISVDDVEKFIYHSRQESVFILFAAMAVRDFSASLDIYNALRLSGEAEAVQLLGGLLWQFRRLHSFMSFTEQGDDESQAFAAASVLGNSAAIRGKHNQQIYRSAARSYTKSEVEAVICALGETDGLCRELSGALHPVILERMIYTIVKNGGTLHTRDHFRSITAVL